MSAHKLVLLPADPEFLPKDPEDLLQVLHQAGFCGAELEEGKGYCRVGDRFLQLVTFLGCSPYLKLAPDHPGDKNFCRVELSGPYRQVEFLGGAALKPPRCSFCRALVPDWRDWLLTWERDRGNQTRQCSKCGQESSLYDLDWRRCAGFGRFALNVWDVHEGEAVPSEEIFNLLRRRTSVGWDYFYA